MDDERRWVLEEAADLGHILGAWEAEEGRPTCRTDELSNHPEVDAMYGIISKCMPLRGERSGSHRQRH
jgi:hypothetical protein